MIDSWSHSKLGDFEKCKFLAYLKHDLKVPEPERPLPPGKTEHANDRGTRVHDNCEQYVRGNINELCIEAEKFFGPQLDMMRILYAEGKVSLEGEWAMNNSWEPCSWGGDWVSVDMPDKDEPTIEVQKLPQKHRVFGGIYIVGTGKKAAAFMWVPAWLRLKLDACVFLDDTQAIVIDYKTGRKFGNEAKHAEQLHLYQLVTFLRYPKLEKVTVELWYLDQDEVTSSTFTRAQGLRFKANFHRRGEALVTCTDFPPNPNVHSCKWCQYGPWNGGQCQVGVRK